MTTPPSIIDFLYEESGPKTQKKIKLFTTLSLAFLAFVLLLVIRQFYINDQFNPRYWSFFTKWTTWLFILKGLAGTLKISLYAAVITFCVAFILMFGRIYGNKVIRALCAVIIEFIRGVPTLLFIYFFFFVIPSFGIKLSAFYKICIPVALSAAGPVAETLRGGINAVPKGQREAALSLGSGEIRTFFKIIFPQAFRYVVPSLIAQLVIVVKDTTFAYVVSYNDLMQNASVLISNYDALVSVYLVVAVIYIITNYLLNKLSVKLARR